MSFQKCISSYPFLLLLLGLSSNLQVCLKKFLRDLEGGRLSWAAERITVHQEAHPLLHMIFQTASFLKSFTDLAIIIPASGQVRLTQ